MNKLGSVFVATLLFVCMGASCEEPDWRDEILLQLSELRREQIRLAKEVVELKGKIAKVKGKEGAGKITSIPFARQNILGNREANIKTVTPTQKFSQIIIIS